MTDSDCTTVAHKGKRSLYLHFKSEFVVTSIADAILGNPSFCKFLKQQNIRLVVVYEVVDFIS